MSAKRFGTVFFDNTKINVWQLLFQAVPLHDTSTNVVFCNQSIEPVEVSMAYTTEIVQSPSNPAETILYRKQLLPSETFVFPVLAVEPGMAIQVIAYGEGVSVLAHGYQDPT